VKVTQKLPGV